MKKLIITVVLFLAACGGGQSVSLPTSAPLCTLQMYKDDAQPLMREVGSIARGTSLSNPDDLTASISELSGLQTQIRGLQCQERFPLKHETLEFSASHLMAALKAVQSGNSEEATTSLNLALLNIERFNDWSVDVD